MGDFMHSKHGLALGICSALSALGVALCIWRMMNWEQAAAVCVAEAGGSWISAAVRSAVGRCLRRGGGIIRRESAVCSAKML